MKTPAASLIALAVGFCLPSRAADNSATTNDLARLQGTWSMVSGTADGSPIPEAMVGQAKRVCKDDEITVKFGERMIFKARITLDASKKPKTIDFQMTDGPNKGKRQLGIYELDGDTLKSCFGAPEAERPKDFSGQSGEMRTSTVWKHDKEAAPKSN
jgi:uncharacterized protein (TIGR03067 family)